VKIAPPSRCLRRSETGGTYRGRFRRSTSGCPVDRFSLRTLLKCSVISCWSDWASSISLSSAFACSSRSSGLGPLGEGMRRKYQCLGSRKSSSDRLTQLQQVCAHVVQQSIRFVVMLVARRRSAASSFSTPAQIVPASRVADPTLRDARLETAIDTVAVSPSTVVRPFAPPEASRQPASIHGSTRR